MPNLIELANNVKNLMGQLTDIDANRERVQALNTRSAQIQKVRMIIDEADRVRAILVDAKVALTKKPVASKNLIDKCQHVIEGIEKNWEKTLRDKHLSMTFIEPAREHAEKKNFNDLKKDWGKFVEQNSPRISNVWLRTLPDSGPLGDAKQNLTRYLEELLELRDDLPKNSDIVARVREISEEATNIFSELEDIPEPVREFLGAASGTGAKLDDLTDEVRAWMVEHGMIDRLRIRLW